MEVSDYPWGEAVIAQALVRQVFKRQTVCVVPNCNWTGAECDLLMVEPRLRIIDVEIKISRSDLKADADKDKWWRRPGWWQGNQRPPSTPLEWPRKVWKHYYALPAAIWKPELVDALPSPASGVILLKAVRHYENSVPVVYAGVARRAKPNADAKPLGPAEVAHIARLASLRLWDALVERDALRERVREARHAA